MTIYIDDTVQVKDPAAVNLAAAGKARSFKVNIPDQVTEFWGCKLLLANEPDKGILKWEGNLKQTNLSAPQRRILCRATANDTLLKAEKHRSYMTIVGKQLYITTKTRPDTANDVRELSKHQCAYMGEHLAAAVKVMQYVLSTQEHYIQNQA